MGKFDFFNDMPESAEEFMENQKQYASLRRDELEGIPEDEIVLAVTSWIESKFAEDWSDMCEKINDLPTPCLNLYCADYVAKEIINGGFAQAFFNASRDYIGVAADGFRALEYPELADVIENALKVHFDSANKPAGRSIEDFVTFSASGEYDPLDSDFCKMFDSGRFNSSAYAYVMKYKKYFGE